MAIKRYKPTSAARRFMTVHAYDEITSTKPEKSLLEDMRKSGGRNNQGKITVRHIGGGNRRKYRIIDFKRNKDDIPAKKVKSIQYDPNRSANIALLQYADGEKRYILAPIGLNVGDTVLSGANADIKAGNCLPFENIPVGTMVHNIELKPGRGRPGRACRRHRGAADGKRGRVRDPEDAQRRNASGARHLPRHHRPGRQRRARDHPRRQSGQDPPHGHPPDRPRRSHEPLRSPARRRRGARAPSVMPAL